MVRLTDHSDMTIPVFTPLFTVDVEKQHNKNKFCDDLHTWQSYKSIKGQ